MFSVQLYMYIHTSKNQKADTYQCRGPQLESGNVQDEGRYSDITRHLIRIYLYPYMYSVRTCYLYNTSTSTWCE